MRLPPWVTYEVDNTRSDGCTPWRVATNTSAAFQRSGKCLAADTYFGGCPSFAKDG